MRMAVEGNKGCDGQIELQHLTKPFSRLSCYANLHHRSDCILELNALTGELEKIRNETTEKTASLATMVAELSKVKKAREKVVNEVRRSKPWIALVPLPNPYRVSPAVARGGVH